jgi:transcriptional regulator with XRE-family HTH domain
MDADLIYISIGRNVRRERQRLKWSQEQLAVRIGLLRTSIANIEAGKQRVPLHTICEIAAALDIMPGRLLPADMFPADTRDAEQRAEEAEKKLSEIRWYLEELIRGLPNGQIV